MIPLKLPSSRDLENRPSKFRPHRFHELFIGQPRPRQMPTNPFITQMKYQTKKISDHFLHCITVMNNPATIMVRISLLQLVSRPQFISYKEF